MVLFSVFERLTPHCAFTPHSSPKQLPLHSDTTNPNPNLCLLNLGNKPDLCLLSLGLLARDRTPNGTIATPNPGNNISANHIGSSGQINNANHMSNANHISNANAINNNNKTTGVRGRE